MCEVSSYAAFALAWMLGLIATTYYLTATYRRSPRLLELALPLLDRRAGAGSSAGLGVAASYGLFGPEWTLAAARFFSSQSSLSGDALFYIFARHRACSES